jgi:hypothetical protein
MGTVVLCGFGYWLGAVIGEHRLMEAGSPVGADLHGLLSALYFSFVTATSVGYGDIVPVGVARVLAVGEAVVGLLIFGAVVAKFVSHRQDELVLEIHQVTFDERLDRVQSNLHVVISELLSINSLCEARRCRCSRSPRGWIALYCSSSVNCALLVICFTNQGSWWRKVCWRRFSLTWPQPWTSWLSF